MSSSGLAAYKPISHAQNVPFAFFTWHEALFPQSLSIFATTMTRIFLCMTAAVATLAACGRGDGARTRGHKGATFTDEVRLPATPVKEQGRGELCWIYAMLATIETDRISTGDSVNLSPDYAARAWMADRTRHCHFSGGAVEVSMRGMATTLFSVLERHGIMPYDSYNTNGKTNYNALARRMTHIAGRRGGLASLDRRAAEAMDNAIGPLPPRVYMFGAEYTPQQFARSVAQRDDYEFLTSFTHHPWGQRFAMETPDNTMADKFLNVPIDTLMSRMVTALRSGHAVCWEGDVTEPGFSFGKGTASTDDGHPCTQERRQREFETLRTTDDHCMAIIGMARDSRGRRFFIAKNSWGTGNPYGGMMYMSENYVRLKTIAIVTKR